MFLAGCIALFSVLAVVPLQEGADNVPSIQETSNNNPFVQRTFNATPYVPRYVRKMNQSRQSRVRWATSPAESAEAIRHAKAQLELKAKTGSRFKQIPESDKSKFGIYGISIKQMVANIEGDTHKHSSLSVYGSLTDIPQAIEDENEQKRIQSKFNSDKDSFLETGEIHQATGKAVHPSKIEETVANLTKKIIDINLSDNLPTVAESPSLKPSHSRIPKVTFQSHKSTPTLHPIPNQIDRTNLPYRSNPFTVQSVGSNSKLFPITLSSKGQYPHEIEADIVRQLSYYNRNTVTTCTIKNIVICKSVASRINAFFSLQLNTLRSLRIIGCKLLEGTQYSFDNLSKSKLKTVLLERNTFSSLHLDDLFNDLPFKIIQELILINNNWEEKKIILSPDIIEKFVSVQKITLWQQKLSETDVSLMKVILGLPELIELNITRNSNISCFFDAILSNNESFTYGSSLETLNLSDNDFTLVTAIQLGALIQLPLLKNLILQTCNLVHLNNEIENLILNTAGSLKQIDLTDSCLDEESFIDFYNSCSPNLRSIINYQFIVLSNELIASSKDLSLIDKCINCALSINNPNELLLVESLLRLLALDLESETKNFIYLWKLKRMLINCLVNEEFLFSFFALIYHLPSLSELEIVIGNVVEVTPMWFEIDFFDFDNDTTGSSRTTNRKTIFNYIHKVSITIESFEHDQSLSLFIFQLMGLFFKSKIFIFHCKSGSSLQWIKLLMDEIEKKKLLFGNCTDVQFHHFPQETITTEKKEIGDEDEKLISDFCKFIFKRK